MSVDPSSQKKRGALRPLPSVNMALLPNELKAQRTRRFVVVTLVGAVVLGAFLLWVARSVIPKTWDWMEAALGKQDAKLAADLGVTDVIPAPQDGGLQEELTEEQSLALLRSRPNARYETLFGTVPSFRGALLNAGLEPEECAEIEAALQHIVDFRRCRPEHKLIVERDENAGLKHFEYHPSPTEFVEVTRDEEGAFRAEQIRVKVERTPIARAASVETSIGDGLAGLGLPAGLAIFFVEAFEGRIDFAVQARKGDVFRIVVDEERVDGDFLRYGRVHAVEYHGQRTGKVQAFYYEPTNATGGQFYDDTGRAMQGGWLRTPLRYERLSSRFNPRRFHPILKRTMPHLGVDYAAPTGTPVWAAAEGRVKFAGRAGINGNLVIIRHRGGFETAYAHLHRIKSGVRPGKYVKQRELIGFVGSTGRSTGPHLHFGLKKYNRFIDPLDELNGPGRRMSTRDLPAYKDAVALWQAELSGIEDAPELVAGADEPLVEQIDEIMD